METNKLNDIKLDVSTPDYTSAEKAAREAVINKNQDMSLIAWWDNERKTGGPMEACGGEVPKCVRDYATSHGAEYAVYVNKNQFEFYFAPRGRDVAQLDREEALGIHRDLGRDSQFDNLQGG